MSQTRKVLVTGATGKQGRSVIDALLALNTESTKFEIVALVRDPATPAATKLAQLPNASVIRGDLNNAAAIFDQLGTGSIWGVYSVQINSDAEVTQGKGVIDAAKKHGVSHFVYASGDRGGPEKSKVDATNVKNFAAKYTIEKHLEQAVASSKETSTEMTYTILRPVTFFENQTNDKHGKGFMRMFMQMQGGHRKLQMISTRDIGWFAAQAFANPTASEYRNEALSLAGDELDAKEAERIFKQVTGQKELPMAPGLIGKALKLFLRDTVGDMFGWFEHVGYGADVAACRRANPAMLNYQSWLEKYSEFIT